MNQLQSIEIEPGPLELHYTVTFLRRYSDKSYRVGVRAITRLIKIMNAYKRKYGSLFTSNVFHDGRFIVKTRKNIVV